jgi:hypothetical protein
MMLEKKNKKKISKKYNQVRRGCICIAAGAKHSRRHSAIDAADAISRHRRFPANNNPLR